MRKAIVLLALVFSVSSIFAQDKSAYQRVFQVKNAKTTADIYNRAADFARKLNPKFKADKAGKSFSVPVTWQYEGGFNQCVKTLDLKARLVIEIKENKTRIMLTGITYQHHRQDEEEIIPVAKSTLFSKGPECAPGKGKIELLYDCADCKRSIKSVQRALDEQFDDFASQYQERLRKL